MTKEWQEASNELAREEKQNPLTGTFWLALGHFASRLTYFLPRRYCIGGLQGQGPCCSQVIFWSLLSTIRNLFPSTLFSRFILEATTSNNRNTPYPSSQIVLCRVDCSSCIAGREILDRSIIYSSSVPLFQLISPGQRPVLGVRRHVTTFPVSRRTRVATSKPRYHGFACRGKDSRALQQFSLFKPRERRKLSNEMNGINGGGKFASCLRVRHCPG